VVIDPAKDGAPPAPLYALENDREVALDNRDETGLEGSCEGCEREAVE
jgi:hypothetical protein